MLLRTDEAHLPAARRLPCAPDVLVVRVADLTAARRVCAPELALELLVHAREPAEVGAEVVPFRLRREQAASHGEMAPDELLGGHAAKVLVEGGGRVAIGALRADGRRETGLSGGCML